MADGRGSLMHAATIRWWSLYWPESLTDANVRRAARCVRDMLAALRG